MTFGDEIQRASTLHNSSSGFVDVPKAIQQGAIMQGLKTVVFDAKVYDINFDDGPAYEEEGLELKLDNMEPSLDMTASITGKKDITP